MKALPAREVIVPPEPLHYQEVRGFLFRTARAEAVPFKKNIVNFIMECRISDGGVPYFRTGFAKRPFSADAERFVQGICYLGRDMITSRWFSEVPAEDFEYMELHNDDYLYVLRKYSSPQDVERAQKAPVVVV